MARLVLDAAVKNHPKYHTLLNDSNFINSSYNNELLHVTTQQNHVKLSKKKAGYTVSLIDCVKSEFNKYAKYNWERGHVLYAGQQADIDPRQAAMLKALLVCTTNASKTLASCFATFAQHVLIQSVQHQTPAGIITEDNTSLESIIYNELSEFYVDSCTKKEG